MDNTLNLILAQVSRKLSVDKKLVEKIYDSYWAFFRDSISQQYYPSIPYEERKEYFVNINLPYIGKLFVSERKINNYFKQHYHYKYVKCKEDKTDR